MKFRQMWGFALIILMVLGSCATSYGPQKLAGGYSEQNIDDITIQVTFEGNQYSTVDQIRTYLTYRCSELTLEHDFTHFMIIKDDSFKHLGADELEDEGITFTTTTSMSGGVNTRVSSGFEKSPTETAIGIFTIKMMPKADPVYATASIDAQVFIESNEHLIKRKK
ncbi:MAG: hypothetical protein U9Q77_02475 [Candidatus Marinimicrobia bacterium]|nr:hypothetical protein [Candidatus Neomarinimicrobiota bacterium]